jgi:Ca2+-binding EF-hand superfamily protein
MQSRVKTNLVSSDRFEPTGWVRGDEAALLLKKELVEGTKIRREHLFTEEESCEGVLTKNAFETLRCLDTDQNGVINQFDMAFKNLRLLFDFDADGVVDEGEMRDLFDVGVGELSLSYSTIPEEEGLKDGNDLRYVSLLKDLEGKISGKLIDVYFGVTRN